MFTLGASPYSALDFEEMLLFIEKGSCLSKPQLCTQKMSVTLCYIIIGISGMLMQCILSRSRVIIIKPYSHIPTDNEIITLKYPVQLAVLLKTIVFLSILLKSCNSSISEPILYAKW